MAELQRTLLLVKPDGVQRQLVGRVLTRFEERGLKIVGLKLVHVDRALAEQHYAVHSEKPFFRGLVDFITSGPLVAAALEGPNAIAIVRAMNGATRPARGRPGLDPRRPRRRDRPEPRPRLGQPRERRRGARPLVPPRGAAQLRARDRPLGARPGGVDRPRSSPASPARSIRSARARRPRSRCPARPSSSGRARIASARTAAGQELRAVPPQRGDEPPPERAWLALRQRSNRLGPARLSSPVRAAVDGVAAFMPTCPVGGAATVAASEPSSSTGSDSGWRLRRPIRSGAVRSTRLVTRPAPTARSRR